MLDFGFESSIVGTIAFVASAGEPASELAPFGLELPGDLQAVATSTEMVKIAIALINIKRNSFFLITPSPPMYGMSVRRYRR